MTNTRTISRVIVYVDGFNLYFGLRSKHERKYHWLDLQSLATSLLRPEQELVVVRYFTARVRNDPQAGARQADYLEGLTSLDKVEINEGRFQEKNMRCRRCQHAWRTYEEKETDVAVATNIVRDAARHSMDTAMVLSGDGDVLPALRIAKEMNPELAVVVAFPPDRTSKELRQFATASFNLRESKLRQSQLPPTVTGTSRTVNRPDHWR